MRYSRFAAVFFLIYIFPGAGILAQNGVCLPSDTRLCLGVDDRFSVEVDFANFTENEFSLANPEVSGEGQAEALDSTTGFFWFLDQADLDVMIRVLDGRPINDHFWVFLGTTSNFEFEIRVTDEVTGRTATYLNPAGTFNSVLDTTALEESPTGAGLLVPAQATSPHQTFNVPAASDSLSSTCVPDEETLCLLGGRFQVRIVWTVPQREPMTGSGQSLSLTDRSGAFWFFHEDNLEILLRVEDGRAKNGNFWFFLGSVTETVWEMTVVDTETGRSQVFANALAEEQSAGDNSLFVPPIHLAQFGGGAGFETRLTLVNQSSTQAATLDLSLFDPSGEKLLAPPPGVEGLVLDQNLQIPAGGSMTIETSGVGEELFLGSISAHSDTPVGALARYSLAAGSAAVGTGAIIKKGKIPFRQSEEEGIRTGLALRNTRGFRADIEISVFDPLGTPLTGVQTRVLQAYERTALFIDELFPTLTAEFEGTVLIEAPIPTLAIIALELGSTSGDFTSISPIPVP